MFGHAQLMFVPRNCVHTLLFQLRPLGGPLLALPHPTASAYAKQCDECVAVATVYLKDTHAIHMKVRLI